MARESSKAIEEIQTVLCSLARPRPRPETQVWVFFYLSTKRENDKHVSREGDCVSERSVR